ncbi:hypothetical protein CfE428DRAFT_0278 [Chthoniobacter flavus Ellin428]|uniref:DUF2292 domain-containing protein n=1 Tax=Chthoniobacter flavus Ellin428 TaxID=497964 RepID=B4CUB5_9BACT|nr:YezD family protein [Chthoniobacter flavus]EDY22153.1 hypothetical protein CfE428DRAFT_0278 [Chthoniobacter flavus Ellin428]TCO94814.1 hypothetical protein EV701_102283 [Chthoniobacter flavus]
MSNSAASSRRPAQTAGDATESAEETAVAAPWVAVVTEKVRSMRYGIVQIVVHDSKVVQIERTERTRFDIPQSTGQR